jgi:hypothetical protein
MPDSKKCANSTRPGHHRSFWQQSRKVEITNLLLINASKCFDFRDENENEVALRTKSPVFPKKF